METMNGASIRIATVEDAELLADTRVRQLLDEGSEFRYDTHADMIDFFRRKISDGSYRAWIAESDGALVSTAAVLYQEYPPSIGWQGARRGYVTSVYTVPPHRGKGYASRLLQEIIADAREKNLGNLWLMASEKGKSVYRKLGFDDERIGHDIYMEWWEG